jgi:excisionase family DNA binding protein
MRKRKGPFISIAELARLGGVSYKHVRLLVLSGAIPSKQIGIRRLIHKEWAERWLAESDPPNRQAAAS